MDPSGYATFSSLDRSHHAVRRLIGSYLPAFDDLRAFAESGSGFSLFLAQRDVTSLWKAILGSAVAAISWDLVQGLDVVMVLLDDPEFGRDIQWYFSPAAAKHVEFKLLLLFVETSLEIILHVMKDPSIIDRVGHTPVVDAPVMERDPERIRSPSFCLAIESGDLVPRQLEQLAGLVGHAASTPILRAVFLSGGPFKAPVFSWAVLAGVRACVARDAACMGRTLYVRLDKAILSQDAFSRSLLLMIKVQLEAIAGMIASQSNPARTVQGDKIP
jgi:hypothetical protein